jgi:penicillin-insensitive murein endopeptidase
MIRIITICFSTLLLFSVYASTVGDPPVPLTNAQKIEQYYEKNKGDSIPSRIQGIESAGTVEHTKLLPFSQDNFRYFDTMSYLRGHAFMADKMQQTLLASYKELETAAPGRIFTYMESGLQNGGIIPGHRTHQCGLSVDLMVPLVKDGQPYYKLDTIGGKHYSLDFDDKGRWLQDSAVTIDFNLLGLQILSLDKQARKQGMHVKKVILKLELKDDLYATLNGKSVKRKGIYLAMNLPPNVNKQHDDHFHVDFELLQSK